MMVSLVISVDGGCRGNGSRDAIGAAAAITAPKWNAYWIIEQGHKSTKKLRSDWNEHFAVTSSRAELEAIILGLQLARSLYDTSGGDELDVTIHSDSQYAIRVMNEWIHDWKRDGWKISRGFDVANVDLLLMARTCDLEVAALGAVKYVWVPREANGEADAECERLLDEMEREDQEALRMERPRRVWGGY